MIWIQLLTYTIFYLIICKINSLHSLQTFSCAGFFAGVTEAILVNPFEVIKVKLQSNRKHIKESPSTFAVTKEIVSKYGFGLNGLNKGLSATIMRNAVFNSFYFGFYHSVKRCIPVKKKSWLEFLTQVKHSDTINTHATILCSLL